MRRTFFTLLYEQMKQNENIFALTGDLGYIGFDRIRDDFPERFINCGASEQALIGIACGLALEGKIPFCYSITPFLLYRPFEQLRTYVNHENIPIKLVGSGRDGDYAHDGYSHDASDVVTILTNLSNIKQFWPEKKEEVKDVLELMIANDKPSFLSLKR